MKDWTYNDELAAAIAEKLETQSLRSICAAPDMPDRSTVMRWMAQSEEFAARCARAREAHADFIFDGMQETEDRVLSGEIDPKAANVVLSSQRWRAEKLKPKVYGAKTLLGSDPENPLPAASTLTLQMTPEQLRVLASVKLPEVD